LIGIAHTSLGGRFLIANRRLCNVLGYSAEELTAIDFMTISHPDEVLQDIDAKTRLIDGTLDRYTREKRYRRKDGSLIWVNVSVSLHRDAAGQPAHFITIVEDLTERKHLEQQVRQTHKMEAVGRFAGGIAHDFNNLLTAIVGYADLALTELRTGDQSARDDIEAIRAAGKSAASLTQQLLAFSRGQILQPQVIDLNSVVDRTKGLLGRLIGEHIEVQCRLATPLDRVSADPGQIERVVLNLALNARDAMPLGGTLSIETSNVELDAAYAADHPGTTAGRHVMLAIGDTGAGIAADVREHLFEPFYTTKAAGRGTGLGLATVYGIVKQSGGSISVHSEPGQGATFKVFLPRVDRAGDAGDVFEVPPAPSATTLHGKEVVLVVEDQREVRSVARETLTRHGYTVMEAANGKEALSVLAHRSGPIDLLLTDLVMPGMSCPDLVAAVRRACPEVRVLYMSGYTSDDMTQRGVIEPGVAFIEKPFAPVALLRKIRNVLGENA
jgi:PAS domain S-box-containing protein